MKRIAIKNRWDSTTPLVVHANGTADSRIWGFIRDQFFATAGAFSPVSDHGMNQKWTDELTLVTWNTRDKVSVLERSCCVLGLPIKVIKAKAKPRRPNTRITYPIKIEATLEIFDEITTPYVMFIDSFDAILLESPARALAVFKKHHNKDEVLFGAERGHFPDGLDTKDKEKKLAADWCCRDRWFLNAGTVIGGTAALKNVYEKAKAAGDSWDDHCLLTDQAAIKTVYAGGECGISIDYHCRIVQNLFGIKAGELELLYVDNGICLEAV